MNMPWKKRIASVAVACAASLSLSGCLILPGEFTSDMTVLKNGDFTFNYKGQIQLLGLANLLNNDLTELDPETEFNPVCYVDSTEDAAEAKTDEKAEKKKEKAKAKAAEDEAALAALGNKGKGSAASATAEEDYDLAEQPEAEATEATEEGDTADAAEAAADAAAEAVASIDDWDMEERDCTAEEIADQKKTWDEEKATRKKQEEAAKKMFSMLLGGIDPKDPATIERFTKEVERLAAWNKVEHLGDGVFMIDYSTKGHLADDFAFPVIPRYAIGEPMIHITRWDNGRVRVEAPAFQNDPDISVAAMVGAGNFMGMAAGKSAPKDPVKVSGTFTLTTDAKILANNTEEGPEDGASGLQILRWNIGSKIYGAPMALLKMVN